MDEDEVARLAGGLRTVVNRLAYVLRRPMAEQGVTPTRLTALITLEKLGPMRPGDLAAKLNISAASVSRLTEALLEGGWVEREPDPDDRRACLLDLTGAGAGSLETLRREGAGELADGLRELPEEDQQALAAALPVLAALADRSLSRS